MPDMLPHNRHFVYKLKNYLNYLVTDYFNELSISIGGAVGGII